MIRLASRARLTSVAFAVLILALIAVLAGGVPRAATGTSPLAADAAPVDLAAAVDPSAAPATPAAPSGREAVLTALREQLGFSCARVVYRTFAAMTGADLAELAGQAAALGPGRFLVPDQGPWTADQMWIGDVSGAARAYGATILASAADEAWLVGDREGVTIGFQLRELEVAPGVTLWQPRDLILPQSCP